MGFHFCIVALIVGKFAVFVHQIVADHVEFQLFIFRIENQPILLVCLCESGAGSVNEAENLAADFMDTVNKLHHFFCISGNGGENHHAVFCEALVAGGEKLRRIFHINRQRGFSAHINFCLHGGGIGAADADKVDAIESLFPDFIDDFFNLRTEGKGAVDAVDVALLVKITQAGAACFFPFIA